MGNGSEEVVVVEEEEEEEHRDDVVDGAVDYRGGCAVRSKSGSWRSAWFIIGKARQ